MKVLVVGGSGFLGSHVADALVAAGRAVRVYDEVPSPYLPNGAEMVVGDIRDQAGLDRAVAGCDAVYNFAAVADIAEAGNDPVAVAEINIVGNLKLIDACRKAKIRRYLFASTVYVYSDKGSFYRCSKQSCELFIEEYQRKYGLAYTILRYGSLYGPRATANNWIRQMLTAALATGKITRSGDGEEVREYIHVLDAAASSVKALAPEFENQHLILTGNSPITIRQLLTMVREMMENKITIEYLDGETPGHYELTPYVFKPRAAMKLVANPHVDLGQGLLEALYELDRERKEKI